MTRPTIRAPRRALLALVAVLALLALPVGSASAHVTVKFSSPGAGTTASTSIRSASVTFTGRLLTGTLTVTGPGGTASSGRGGRDPRNLARVKVPLKRGLSGGTYTARWGIVASDGHAQSGSFSFTLRRPRR
jgi:copper resistance protein C